jgi:hypothetical protein
MTGSVMFRRAGVSAYLAILALALPGIFLALFFGGAGELFGPLNDMFVALAMALLVLPAWALLEVEGLGGRRWFRVLTWLTIAGLILATVGQLLLVAGLITLEMSFVTGGLGILPVLAWVVAQGYLGPRTGIPSRAVGATAATIVLAVLLTVASGVGSTPPRGSEHRAARVSRRVPGLPRPSTVDQA